MSGSFAIVANGFADGPAQALRDHLVARGARIVAVSHPLSPEQGTRHVVERYAGGGLSGTRSIAVPLRPPASFAADPFVPLRMPRVDAWIGFNPLACARGLVERRIGRARRAILWSVDFVPDRFGRGTALTRLYDRLDKLCCTRADARVELSAAAREAREHRHGLSASAVPTHVVPMGAWLGRVPTVPADGPADKRVVFLGHLVERQGVPALVDAIAILRDRGQEVLLDVIGTGPQEGELRERAARRGLKDAVRFHGFVEESGDVERLLADASLAVAPYETTEDTFTRWADPGKLKAYLAAGLPIVLTDVPPNAAELASEAGAELVAYDAEAIATAIADGLSSPEQWRERRARALAYVRRFDWAVLLDELLAKLGLAPEDIS